MTIEEAILILQDLWRYEHVKYKDFDVRTALDMSIKALEQCEVWNGAHGQIIVPKGTFDKIWEDANKESED